MEPANEANDETPVNPDANVPEEKQTKLAQTIAETAIATALSSTCFQPSIATSPVSTPLRPNFLAAPPDWSQVPRQQQINRTPPRGDMTSFAASPLFTTSHSSGGSMGTHSPVASSGPVFGQPQLSLSRSGEASVATMGLNSSFHSVGTPQILADTSVLLGLEELERQQADLEMRRAVAKEHEERETHRKQQHELELHSQRVAVAGNDSEPRSAAFSSGLPPLGTVLSSESAHHGNHAAVVEGGNVPSQIHLMEEDDHTALTSEVTDTKGQGDTLKRATSVGKLRGQMSVSLRRLRSWSLNASNENPVGSVDSTQNASRSRTSVGFGPDSQTGSVNAKSNIDMTDIEEPYLEDGAMKPLIFGYLHKLGRNGHWQKRYFETNGERLTYYKTVKRAQLLATLDLCKVGVIAIDPTDPDFCTFTIQVSNRPYFLRAEDKTQCNDWVITLNRAREARMNMGNIQLVTPTMDDPHRSQIGGNQYAPCIVISSLRPRTHGSDLPPDLLTCHTEEEQQQIEVMSHWDHEQMQKMDSEAPSKKPYFDDPGSQGPMAKWQKKHSMFHQLSLRVLNWARSITKQVDACRREQDVVVVPAHVLRAATSQTAQSPPNGDKTATAAQATSSARRKVSGPDLPVLTEEKTEGKVEGPNRSRTSTESTAGGIGGSQYV